MVGWPGQNDGKRICRASALSRRLAMAAMLTKKSVKVQSLLQGWSYIGKELHASLLRWAGDIFPPLSAKTLWQKKNDT